VVGGYDGANVQVIKTDVNGELQVDVLTQPAISHTTSNIAIGDGTDLLAITASGEALVLLTTALPAGTNNIGDVDVLSEPATVADGGALPAVVKVVGGYDGTNVQVLSTDTTGKLRVAANQHSKVDLLRNDYTGTNVTTAAYVQLIASTSSDINVLDIFDSSGETLVFAVGAAASEVNQFYIAPGGNGKIELYIPSGSRLSVKAVSATASTGELIINTFS
jgi:hypothetical protein